MLPLLEHLRSIGRFQWILNPGNAGDGIIAAGTRRLFDEAGLSYHITTRDNITAGMPAVYGGGGAWCRAFGIGPEIVRQIAPIAGSVIVLPSTFEKEKLLLVRGLPNLFLYGRDQYSVKIAREAGFSTAFAPDLAFHCTIPPLHECGGKGVLAAFRRDRIGTVSVPELTAIGANKIQDISREGTHESDDQLLRQISRFDTVHTDRLHVAIAAAMTGRDTWLYPNGDGYRKNVDLFQATLRHFSNCRLAGDGSRPTSPGIQIVIPHCPGRDAELSQLMQSLDESDWPVSEFPPLICYDNQRNQSRNALHALTLGVRTGADFLLYLENDVIVNRHLWHNLQSYPNLQHCSLMTLYGCIHPYSQTSENVRIVHPDHSWGAQGILLSRSTAEHCISHWEHVSQFAFADLRLFHLAGELGANEMHAPSIVQHTGRDGATSFHEVSDFDPDWRRPCSGRQQD